LLTFAADQGGGGETISRNSSCFRCFKPQPFLSRLMHMKFVAETVGPGLHGSTDKQETSK